MVPRPRASRFQETMARHRASGIPVPTERPRYPCQKFVAVLGYPEEEVLAVGVSKP